MTTPETYQECFLHVDAKDIKQVTAVLEGTLGKALPNERFEVGGFEVDVSKNGFHRKDQPDTVENWPIIVEVEADGPAGPEVVRFVSDLMRYVRWRGHRVGAACDYAGELPRG